MVKYLALTVALVGSLVMVDLAEARGRRGCSSCGNGGCPGGVCYAPVAPTKTASTDNAPPAPVAESAPAGQPAAVANTTQSAPRTYYASNTGRRGLFGWRR
jgi:hypothetical protein